jgi:hypothetical protein
MDVEESWPTWTDEEKLAYFDRFLFDAVDCCQCEECQTDIPGLLREFGTSAIPLLVKALRHELDYVRIEAADSLGLLGSLAREAVPALQAAMSDTSLHIDERQRVSDAANRAIQKITVPPQPQTSCGDRR